VCILENKPGRLTSLAAASRRRHRQRTLTLADTAQYGILRMNVSDW
jgi:hypothetical protein